VRTTLHSAGKSVTRKTHTESGHLTSSEAGFNHHVTPFVHAGFPIREVRWDDLRNVISDFCRSLTNGPEESPLGIKFGREL